MKFINVYRRYRSSRIGYEWFSHEGVRWLHVWIGSPTHHRWWATSIYFWVTGNKTMWNAIKFVGIIIVEHYHQILAARREAEIERQEAFVAQLGGAYEEHEFLDYKERYEREAEKLFWMKTVHEGMTTQVTRHNNIQRI